MGEHIRLAPPRPTRAWTDEEALDAAQAAFTDAKLAYGEAQSEFGHLTTRLFARVLVNRGRLISLRSQTRDAIDKALAVEVALTRAIEAIEATAPRSPR